MQLFAKSQGFLKHRSRLNTFPMGDESENQETDSAAEIAELRAKVARLTTESAKYRTERNASLRLAHAQGTVLHAHNVNTDGLFDESALDGLTIENGAVAGDFAYEVPKLASQRQAAPVRKTAPAEAGISEDWLSKASTKEINERWDDVSAFLESHQAA